jgi:NADP-dependent 3-hydroxy acid dehydrogenase YdfG
MKNQTQTTGHQTIAITSSLSEIGPVTARMAAKAGVKVVLAACDEAVLQ